MQVAAHDLGLPLSSVFIAETATDKIPNASPTAASASSDMYGGAIADACSQLNQRLAPFKGQCGPAASFAVRQHTPLSLLHVPFSRAGVIFARIYLHSLCVTLV